MDSLESMPSVAGRGKKDLEMLSFMVIKDLSSHL